MVKYLLNRKLVKEVKPKKLLEFFETALETQSLGKLPDGYDEVYICDSARIQTKTAKVIFVVGANEGVFPLYSDGAGLFSEFEAQKLRDILDLQLRDTVNARRQRRQRLLGNLPIRPHRRNREVIAPSAKHRKLR